jgi:uncharacterized membrane protein YidH (DUF202 family)
MNPNERKALLRAEAAEEARQDEERESGIERRLRAWKRTTLWVGVALLLCILAIVPFADGGPLHQHAGNSTKFLVYLAMCLLAVFMYAVGTSYVVWNYLRATRKTHKKFAPPGSNYRIG